MLPNKTIYKNWKFSLALLMILFCCCNKKINPTKDSLFDEALKRKDSTRIKKLVHQGADINKRHMEGGTLLFWLAVFGDVDRSKIVLENGADFRIANHKGETPLHAAAIGGRLGVVQLLVEHGADINAKDIDGFTPLMGASLTGETDVVKYLVQHGAELNQTDDFGETPLILAKRYPDNKDTIDYLISAGAKTNKPDKKPEEAATCNKPFPVFFALIVLLMFLFTVVYLVANWKMYRLLGKPGWASIVPLYNMVVLFQVAKRPWWWVFLYLIPVLGYLTWIPIIDAIVKILRKPTWHCLIFFFLRPFYVVYLGFFHRRPQVHSAAT